MTAEVAIMNKLGVALAADSMVTIGDKTYDTTNKIFTLSKVHPVGVVVYNAMEMTTLPLETIVKNFRADVGSRERPELLDYSNDLLRYVRTRLPVGKGEESRNIDILATDRCRLILSRHERECRRRRISIGDSSAATEVRAVLHDVMDRFDQDVRQAGKYPSLSRVREGQLLRSYPDVIENRVRRQFRRFRLSSRRIREATLLIARDILSNSISNQHSGLVVAGYGGSEYYPSLVVHETDGFVMGRLKILSQQQRKISYRRPAHIEPFAQTDMAELLVGGVDPRYQNFVDSQVNKLLTGIPSSVARHFGIRNGARLRSFRRAIQRRSDAFIQRMADERQERFIDPLYDAVRFLEKSELATLAENLVAVTALKQKMDLNIATVGGPIDVAVISRNDGFIWIKRKYYFEEKYNRFFMQNYLNFPTRHSSYVA